MSFSNKYKLGKELGKGAYGQVRLITNKRTKEKFVIKLFDFEALKKKRFEKMKKKGIQLTKENKKILIDSLEKTLKREYEMLRIISGVPNTVRYYEKFDEVKIRNKTYLGLVMEYIEGYPLSKFADCAEEANKQIPKDILQKFMLEMFRTVALLHNRNIVHRDIKLQNIIFNRKELRLVDFGLACVLEDATDVECLPRSMGTIPYYAPEILDGTFKDDLEILKASDIWALGITFYYLIHFDFPFKGVSSLANMKKGKYQKPKHRSKIINEIIEKCLTPDWRKRPTAEELYEMLL